MIEMPAPSDGGAALLQRLRTQHGFAPVSASTLADFAAGGDAVLLLTDEPARSPETFDLAVVLPEILKSLPGAFRPGVASPADSRAIAADYAVLNTPALLFLRAGGYVGCIEGLREWADFVAAVAAMKDAPVARKPGIGIPLRSADGNTCH